MNNELLRTMEQFAETVELIRIAITPFVEQYMKAVHEFAVKVREQIEHLPADSELRKALEEYSKEIENSG